MTENTTMTYNPASLRRSARKSHWAETASADTLALNSQVKGLETEKAYFVIRKELVKYGRFHYYSTLGI